MKQSTIKTITPPITGTNRFKNLPNAAGTPCDKSKGNSFDIYIARKAAKAILNMFKKSLLKEICNPFRGRKYKSRPILTREAIEVAAARPAKFRIFIREKYKIMLRTMEAMETFIGSLESPRA